jgi:hypothetical protein
MSLPAQSATESSPNALGKRFLEGDSDENEDGSSDGSDSSSGSGSKRRKRSLWKDPWRHEAGRKP